MKSNHTVFKIVCIPGGKYWIVYAEHYFVNSDGYMTNQPSHFPTRAAARAALALYRERCYL